MSLKNTLKQVTDNRFKSVSSVVATSLVVLLVVALAALAVYGLLGILDSPDAAQAGLQFQDTGNDEIEVRMLDNVRADTVYFKDNDGVITDSEGNRYELSEPGDRVIIPNEDINGDQLTVIGVINGNENVIYIKDVPESFPTGRITGTVSPYNEECNTAGGQPIRLINEDGDQVAKTYTDESGIFIFEGFSRDETYTVDFCDNGGAKNGDAEGQSGSGFIVGGAGHGGGGGASGGYGSGGSLDGAGWAPQGSGYKSGDSVQSKDPDSTQNDRFCGGEVRKETNRGQDDIDVKLYDDGEVIREELDLGHGDKFCFEDVPVGKYKITANAPDHYKEENEVIVTEDTTTVNNFYLKAKGSDYGTVGVGILTSDRNESADITVQLINTSKPKGSSDRVMEQATGGHREGKYLSSNDIVFNEKIYRVKAFGSGYESYKTRTFEFRDDTVEYANVYMVQQDKGTVTGIVEDDTGAVIENATVYETSMGTETQTDENGEYKIKVLPNQKVEVGAYKSGYKNDTETVIVSENEERTVDFTLDRKFGDVEGYVTTQDDYDNAGDGITVELTDSDGEVVRNTTVTKSNSSFKFEDVLAVDYTVTATDAQYQDASKDVSVTENNTSKTGEIYLENIQFDIVVDNRVGRGDANTINGGIDMASNYDNIIIKDSGLLYNDFTVDGASNLYIIGENNAPIISGSGTVNSDNNEIRGLEITDQFNVNGNNNTFREIDNELVVSGDNNTYINGETDTVTVESTANNTFVRDTLVTGKFTDNGESTTINNNVIENSVEVGGSETTIISNNTITADRDPVNFTGAEHVKLRQNTIKTTDSTQRTKTLFLFGPVKYHSLAATNNEFDGGSNGGGIYMREVDNKTVFNKNTVESGVDVGMDIADLSNGSIVGNTINTSGPEAIRISGNIADSVNFVSNEAGNTVIILGDIDSIGVSILENNNIPSDSDRGAVSIAHRESDNYEVTNASIETRGNVPVGVNVRDHASVDISSLNTTATDTGIKFRDSVDATVDGKARATATDGVAVKYGNQSKSQSFTVTSTVEAYNSNIGHQINNPNVTIQGGSEPVARNNTIGAEVNEDATITDSAPEYSNNTVGVEINSSTDVVGINNRAITTTDNDVGIRLTDNADSNIMNIKSERDTVALEINNDTTVKDSEFVKTDETALEVDSNVSLDAYRNDFTDFSGTGVNITNTNTSIKIQDNTFKQYTGTGVYSDNDDVTIVRRNTFNDSTFATGVEVTGSNNDKVNNNIFNQRIDTGVAIRNGAAPRINNNTIYADTYVSSETTYSIDGSNWYNINRANGTDAEQETMITDNLSSNTAVNTWCMDSDCEVTSERPTGDLNLTIKSNLYDDTTPITVKIGSEKPPDGQIEYETSPNETVLSEDVWKDDADIELNVNNSEKIVTASATITENENNKTIIIDYNFNADTDPSRIEYNNTVYYKSIITNTQDEEQTVKVNFTEDGTVIKGSEVVVPADSSETVTFEYTAPSDTSVNEHNLSYVVDNGLIEEEFTVEFYQNELSHSKHNYDVKDVEYDLQNNIIWSGDEHGDLIGYDVSSTSVKYNNYTGNVRDIDYDSNNNIVWIGGGDGYNNKIKGYSVADEEVIYEHSLHDNENVNDVKYVAEDDIILSVGDDGKIIGWNVSTQSKAYEHTEDNAIRSVDYDSQNNTVWAGGLTYPYGNYRLIGYDADTETVTQRKEVSGIKGVENIAYDSDNHFVWTSYGDKVSAYDIENDNIINEHKKNASNVDAFHYDAQNEVILSDGSDNPYGIVAWNSNNEENVYNHSDHTDNVNTVDYDNQNNIVWSGGDDNAVIGKRVTFDEQSNQQFTLQADKSPSRLNYSETVEYKPVITNENNEKQVINVKLEEDGTVINETESIFQAGETKIVTFEYTAPSDASSDNTNLKYNVNNNADTEEFTVTFTDNNLGHSEHSQYSDKVNGMTIDYQNELVWSGDSREDVVGWDYKNKEVDYRYSSNHRIDAADYDSNNNIVWLSGGSGDFGNKNGSLTGWSINDEKIVYNHTENSTNNGIDYDANNNIVWIARDNGTVAGWSVTDEKIMYEHNEHGGKKTLDVHYDDKNNIVWSGSEDNSVIGYNITTEQVEYKHTEHTKNVNSVDYDDKNNIVWSGGRNDNIIGYNITTEQVEYQYNENDGYSVDDLEYNNQENVVISGNSDGNVTVWDVDSESVDYEHKKHHKDGEYSTVNAIDYDANNNILWSGGTDNNDNAQGELVGKNYGESDAYTFYNTNSDWGQGKWSYNSESVTIENNKLKINKTDQYDNPQRYQLNKTIDVSGTNTIDVTTYVTDSGNTNDSFTNSEVRITIYDAPDSYRTVASGEEPSIDTVTYDVSGEDQVEIQLSHAKNGGWYHMDKIEITEG